MMSATPSSTPSLPCVGLAGLGLMGAGMGQSLLRAGFPLRVLPHRRRETAWQLQAQGATVCEDPGTLVAGCDVVILCLPGEAAVDAVLFGPAGIAAIARPGLLVLECSTLTPATGRRLHRQLAQKEIAFADAPVTGGPTEAADGRLQALLGLAPGPLATRAEAVLGAFSHSVRQFGAPGQGYAAKLINNFLAFANLAAVAEALATAERAGLDLPALFAAIGQGGGQSRCLDGLTPWVAGTGTSRSRVHLSTALKDMECYLDLSAQLNTLGPLAPQIRSALNEGVEAGLGGRLTPAYLSHVAARHGARIPPAP